MQIPAVELTPSEAIPFGIGLAHAVELEHVLAPPVPDLADVWPVLTRTERDQALMVPRAWFLNWVMIGVMQHHMTASIKIARGE